MFSIIVAVVAVAVQIGVAIYALSLLSRIAAAIERIAERSARDRETFPR